MFEVKIKENCINDFKQFFEKNISIQKRPSSCYSRRNTYKSEVDQQTFSLYLQQ
jgi:hypothetical protein